MKRTRFQGVLTVVRFNWHLYALALATLLSLGALAWLGPAWLRPIAACASAAGLVIIATSLAVTWAAYDGSGLYELNWLEKWIPRRGPALNIHAGFDETTALLRSRFPGVTWQPLDFYDPAQHTEVSIRRARRAHPPTADTVSISTRHLPLPDTATDCVLLTLAAHEIRDSNERVCFFRELHRVLTANGVVIVTEHLRDLPNIVAYNFGAWHFHRASTWMSAFDVSGFSVVARFKPAPFITTFVLKKHGVAA